METKILSETFGAVTTFYCDEGCSVEQGEPILGIECMKLMFDLYATVSGSVFYKCRLGDVVEDGQLVAVIRSTK
jgi:biotin carboxyl carrier protein